MKLICNDNHVLEMQIGEFTMLMVEKDFCLHQPFSRSNLRLSLCLEGKVYTFTGNQIMTKYCLKCSYGISSNHIFIL